MTKNPLVNALAATAYIFLVVAVMNTLSRQVTKDPKFIAPVLALCMFTLSAAVMGYVFGAKPIQLYLDGNKKEGVKLFLQTVGVFALVTILILILVFAGLFRS